MEYQILKCTEEDKEWLFGLHERAMREYVEKVYGWDPEREKAYFDNKRIMSRYHLILNEKDGKIGAINFEIIDDAIKIYRIEILPNYQNKGIGSVILDKMIEKSKDENKNIELRVFKINPAHRLYSRKGFKIFKESDTHFYMKYENK